MDVTHPFQVQRQLWPDHVCLFNTKNFDLDSHVSQRASYPDRLLGIWRRLRGYGDRASASLGVADYERKHWVPAKAVERMFAIMEENISKQTNWSKRERKHALDTLDELRRQYAEYRDERASRADNLRQFILNRLWLLCFPDKEFFPTHTMLEPSMPIYSLEIMPWVPKTADWCAEALELDRQEPWRVGWLNCPEKHTYNTVLVPCNSIVPLFLPSGSTIETVGPAIIPDSSVNSADIDPSWNIAFRGDPEEEEEEEEEEGQVTAEDESSLASVLPGSPALSSASNYGFGSRF
ncbi:hypothetical protein PHMEG_00025867 [Phytophthora megakarya]|uniref:Uncharacterized protein n=1 Tax=Phytophthora megakarya TaxID=4795 RepID=A0A225VAL8_9STRA|nr:hypothetical protein PHMEG_00025867 [Phytophthora megakarya]